MDELVIQKINAIEERQQRIESMLQQLLSRGEAIKDVMNTKELAVYLGITPGRVRRLVCNGEIPVHKNLKESRNFFRREEIDQWRLSRRVKTNDELRREAASQIRRHA